MDSNNQPLVLEYTKRRYDGGSEIELIQQIEMQYELAGQLSASARAHTASRHPHHHLTVNTVEETPDVETTETDSKPSFQEAIMQSCSEFILGVVGILFGSLLCLPFMKGVVPATESFQKDRDLLLQQSWHVVGTSFRQLLQAPLKAWAPC